MSNPIRKNIDTIFHNYIVAQFQNGAWLSPVERVVWDHEIGGSNPLAPKLYNTRP